MDEAPHLARGRAAEEHACRRLRTEGLRLITRNYRCAAGELDLVMADGEQLVFVEVRLRRNPHFGSGADTVGPRKQARLIAAALHYIQHHRCRQACRFDVVSVGPEPDALEWIRDAFHATY
jgi:putative endonuclease